MSERRAAFAAAAESLVGTRFRFRGRDSQTGLDCVGLVTSALQAIGSTVPHIAPYALRQRDFTAQLASVTVAGFDSVGGAVERGDLLLLEPGPAQLHLAIAGAQGSLIHAHAGLGRVVLTPAPCPFPIQRHWRLRED
jgi:cell wall-associated NlpC family hydrolase